MSEIRLLIDDSSAPWAETYCTVQSFKRQQGGVDHRPVQYRVATDFPGVVTMTTPAGVVRTLTADYSATLPLDEGGVTIKADGSAVSELESGTYYVWLKQEESSLELEVIVVVDMQAGDPWINTQEIDCTPGGVVALPTPSEGDQYVTLHWQGDRAAVSSSTPWLLNGSWQTTATPGDETLLPLSPLTTWRVADTFARGFATADDAPLWGPPSDANLVVQDDAVSWNVSHWPSSPYFDTLRPNSAFMIKRCEVPSGFACHVSLVVRLSQSGNLTINIAGTSQSWESVTGAELDVNVTQALAALSLGAQLSAYVQVTATTGTQVKVATSIYLDGDASVWFPSWTFTHIKI